MACYIYYLDLTLQCDECEDWAANVTTRLILVSISVNYYTVFNYLNGYLIHVFTATMKVQGFI